MNKFNWKQFWVTLVIVGLLAGWAGYAWHADTEVTVDQEAVDAAISEATGPLNFQIEGLKQTIVELQAEELEEEIVVVEIEGHTIDKIFLGVTVDEILSDRDVSLFDGEVEFDGKNYDAEETLILKDIELLANEPDFEGVPFMTVLEGAISYVFEFESTLNTSEISDDETLTFNLLGNEVEVSEWDVDTVTFSQGEEHRIIERLSITVNEKVVVLDWVGDEKVYVLVDGIGASINEGKTKKINGLEIRVADVMYSEKEGRESRATLVIGDEVSFEVSDGEEYEEDSIWEWVITESSIGLVLTEEFMELDEDFNALAPGESVCLPNDYLCVTYKGVVEEESEVYTFEIDGDFVEARGNFLSGIEDFTRVYINSTGIFDRDDVPLGNEIELGDTGLKLVANATDMTINDIVIPLTLDAINVGSHDEDFMTDYGILVDNTEDAIDDKQFKITVPEEELEAELIVN